MATYDPAVIQKAADKLYAQAAGAMASSTVLGVLGGGVGGYVLGSALGQLGAEMGVVGAILIGLAGLAIGMQRAAGLRLQAQVALCQLQIEANTRRG